MKANHLRYACAICLIALASGCMCCNLPDGLRPSTTTSTTIRPLCSPPYLQVGGECCLDANQNGICDMDEVPATSRSPESTPITLGTVYESSMMSSSSSSRSSSLRSSSRAWQTSTTQPATTTTQPNPKAECARRYGVTPDTVIYLYTEECCSSLTVMVVEPVEEKGFVFRYVDMGSLTQMDNALLSCFYPNQMQDIFVPQFICAANGNSILVSSPSGAKTKVQQFAEDCRAAA